MNADIEPDQFSQRAEFLPWIAPPMLRSVDQENVTVKLRPDKFIVAAATLAEEHLRKARPSVDLVVRRRSRLVQFCSAENEKLHYEIWIHENICKLEIGFHMEDAPSLNRAIYRALDRDLLSLRDALGERLWLEEWDHGWARLYETYALWPLTEQRASEAAERIVALVGAVDPLLRSLGFVGDGSSAHG